MQGWLAIGLFAAWNSQISVSPLVYRIIKNKIDKRRSHVTAAVAAFVIDTDLSQQYQDEIEFRAFPKKKKMVGNPIYN